MNNFKLKARLIAMVQQQKFRGHSSEYPNNHISISLELCVNVKMNSVDLDVIKLKLFPFSFKDKTNNWFQGLPRGSIDT